MRRKERLGDGLPFMKCEILGGNSQMGLFTLANGGISSDSPVDRILGPTWTLMRRAATISAASP